MTANDSAPAPICKHGLIGDLRTCALVTTKGAIDYWCWPELDSPSLFTALLDDERSGIFTLSPEGEGWRTVQFYLPDSNILQTRWLAQNAVIELNDFMPITADNQTPPCIVRRVKVVQGEATLTMLCRLKFDYARVEPDLHVMENTALWQAEGQQSVTLNASVALRGEANAVQSRFTLQCGEEAFFIIGGETATGQGQQDVERMQHETLAFWQQWVGKNKYRGRWREMVIRSSLVLKLLSSKRHGSVAAAATFSLPELIGGERNWDYRAGWIRDASFSCYALIRLGYIEEAKAFGHWVRTCMENSQFEPHKLQVMYRLDSGTDLQEYELPHLQGHLGSTPVRIGNGAWQQRQLDIYGELLDTLYLTTKYGDGIPHRGWQHVIRLVDHVCDIWNSPDAGIWEMRGEPEHFLYSRLMCWVALAVDAL